MPSSLATVGVLLQSFLLLVVLACLATCYSDLRAWVRGIRARRARFHHYVELGIFWKPK